MFIEENITTEESIAICRGVNDESPIGMLHGQPEINAADAFLAKFETSFLLKENEDFTTKAFDKADIKIRKIELAKTSGHSVSKRDSGGG